MRVPFGRAALVLLSATVVGCASGQSYVGQVSHEAGKSAVEGITEGISTAPGPIRRALRDSLLGDDTLPLVSQRIAEATVNGVRMGLSGAETQQVIDDIVTRTVAMLGRDTGEASRQLIQTIEPELSGTLRRAIADVSVTLSDNIDRDLTPRTREMARAISEVLVSALAGGLDVQLEHIRQTARGIGREMITEAALSMRDQKEFVGEITHVAMRQGMAGAMEGFRENLPHHVPASLLIAVAVLAMLVGLSGGGLVVYWSRYRQLRREVAEQLPEAPVR